MARRGVSFGATVEAWTAFGAIILAVWLVRGGYFEKFVDAAADYGALAAFIPGLLYSTFVTTPIAVGGFVEMSSIAPIWHIALLGAFGATLADVAMINGARSPLMTMLLSAIFGSHFEPFLKEFASGRRTKYLAMACAWLLIAIPLPTDEVAMTLLGRSKLRGWRLLPFFYIADFVGIFVLLSFIEVFAH